MNATNYSEIDKLVNSFSYPFTKVYISFNKPNPIELFTVAITVQHDRRELKRRILEESYEDNQLQSYTFNALTEILKKGFCIQYEAVEGFSYYSLSETPYFDFHLHFKRIIKFCGRKRGSTNEH